MGCHVPGRLSRADHHSEQVDRHDAVKIAEVFLEQPRVASARNPGVVEHDVQPAEGLDREGDELSNLRQLRDVGLLEGDLRPAARGERLPTLPINVGDDDPSALCQKPLRRVA